MQKVLRLHKLVKNINLKNNKYSQLMLIEVFFARKGRTVLNDNIVDNIVCFVFPRMESKDILRVVTQPIELC